MKNIISLLIISLSMIVVMSCVPSEDKRWTPYEKEELPQEERSTVLVEEYTGGNCTNCPSAAKSLMTLKKKYNDRLVIVSLHPLRTGLALEEMSCKEADEYALHFAHSRSVPGVMINRRPVEKQDNIYFQNKSLWPAFIHDAVNSKASYRLELEAEYTSEKKLRIKALPKAIGTGKADLKLQLWLVEDIIGNQKTPGGLVKNYFHHNVLRKALNGTWGETCREGEALDYVFDLPDNVTADNAKVVAYIYESGSRRVLEAAIKPLGKGISPEDEEEGGGGPELDVEELGFFLEGKRIKSGDEIKVSGAKKNDFLKVIEMETLPIVLAAGKKWSGEYKIEIYKLNNLGSNNGGLDQICLNGHCFIATDTEKYSDILKKPTGVEEDFMQLHYIIPLEKEALKADYKVAVSIKKDGEEAFRFTILFSYSPS